MGPYFVETVRAFDERQQVALHAFAADASAPMVSAGVATLIDLIDEHDAVLLGSCAAPWP